MAATTHPSRPKKSQKDPPQKQTPPFFHSPPVQGTKVQSKHVLLMPVEETVTAARRGLWPRRPKIHMPGIWQELEEPKDQLFNSGRPSGQPDLPSINPFRGSGSQKRAVTLQKKTYCPYTLLGHIARDQGCRGGGHNKRSPDRGSQNHQAADGLRGPISGHGV